MCKLHYPKRAIPGVLHHSPSWPQTTRDVSLQSGLGTLAPFIVAVATQELLGQCPQAHLVAGLDRAGL